jgi:carboxylesterase type B
VDQGVVVVSVNYRLGIFGFLGSTQLSDRSQGGGSGNFGIQDQRAAMQWVQSNIAAFGGDRTRVMIHGCSAGGVSIANHLTQPLSWPYFTSATMESGNQLTFTDALPMAEAQASYDEVLTSLGCGRATASLSCLLAQNASSLLAAQAYIHASPVVDGVNLLDFPRRLLRAGKIKHVPTIVGSARDEVAGLEAATLMKFANMTASGFRAWLAKQYGAEHVERMLALYPPSSAPVGAEGGDCAGAPAGTSGCTLYYYLVVAIASDDMVKCGARQVAQLLPPGTTYQYNWAYPNSPDGGSEPNHLTTQFVGHCSQNPCKPPACKSERCVQTTLVQ